MLKYGMLAKAVELLCFKPSLTRLAELQPDMDMAAFVFSLHKAEPARITPAVVDEMVTAVFDSPFMIKAHKNKKCTLFTDKVQDKKLAESKASQHSPYELDWKFIYEKGVDEFYNTYTECGICKLGKRENCFAFVACLCNMDERNYRNEGGRLHRTKTLANGDDCCNFHVTRIKNKIQGKASIRNGRCFLLYLYYRTNRYPV